MTTPVLIGGAPAVVLQADPPPGQPGVVEATVLPGRGFMLLQAVAALPDGRRVELLQAPDLAGAARTLDGGPDDFAGNKSFSFGGAILAPYANRVQGRPVEGVREIEARIGDSAVRLPRNWGGKAPGAATYAMHGLILATAIPTRRRSRDAVSGRLAAGDFGHGWPGDLDLAFRWSLRNGGLRLRVVARNRGRERSPFAAGWHPYFRLPSGDRRQAVLQVPARLRTEVNNYDEVLPTGRLLEVAGTAYDFTGGGRALGDLYLDDCFTGLATRAGRAAVAMADPAGGLGVRVSTRAPPVRAFQVYAPPDQAFVVLEPQFNLADPCGSQWPKDLDTGLAWLAPGEATEYAMDVSLFTPASPRPSPRARGHSG